MSNNLSNAGLFRFPTPGTPPGYRTPPPRTPSPRADVSRGVAHQPEGNSSEAGDDQSLPVPNPPPHTTTRRLTPNVDKKRRDIRLSMTGKTILISLEEFMNRFIPAPPGETEPVEAFKAVDFTGIPQDIESDMYGPLVAAFNQEWLLPHDIPVSAPHKGDGTVASNQKIDGGLYLRGNAPQDSTSWSSIELSIECKIDATKQDPFDDKTKNPEASAITRKDVRGQIMCYAVLVFDNQHRVHHFTLLILGAMARLVRWDRSGVLVTHKFDYTKEPEKLAQFLWRFGRMTPAQRGHDTTAVRVLPGSADFRLMHARATTPLMNRNGRVIDEHARDMFEQSLKVTVRVCIEDDSGKKTYDVVEKDAPLWRLTVHGEQGPRHFLVGKPHTTAASLAGRGTRTYVAIDTADPDGQFVYMKDAWRVAHDGIDQEGKILKKLNDDSDGGPVVGVPTLRCHGDVVGQVTISQDVWREKHPTAKHEDCPLKTHRHYRLVVNEVCLPMSKFSDFWELVSMLIDCINAHGHAYSRKGLLHRDISAGNVLIYPKVVDVNGKVSEQWVGLLADWELAKQVRKTDAEDVRRQLDRTGTWQFASAMALDNPTKRIIVQDDIESFFHLLLYFAIRYLPHNCDNVGDFMDRYFDGYREVNGEYYGGEKKLLCMKLGLLTTPGAIPLEFYIPKQNAQPADSQAGALPSHEDVASEASAVCPHLPDQKLLNSPCPSISNESVNSSRNSPCVGPSVAQFPVTADGANESLELHPINAIFAGLLKSIKAHYTLYFTPRTTSKTASAQSTMAGTFQAPHAASLEKRSIARLRHIAMGLDTPASTSADSLIAGTAPTDKQKKELADLAAKLGDHRAMVSLLSSHINSDTWPTYVDRIPDQLPKNYRRGNETALGSKRTFELTQIETDEPPNKRSRSIR
ncbi:hypothetical protein BN946_scf184912.g5 [Trametes cinnabarina]|uniref:Fungal-type protein kinase domain-containing protein n=1 Tax=Pycnoporus cinnabarinus TaxID=5643 RepID=A0A060STN5_PYCCI|nr:hypothetical protein BN946_scf184912.g5 [Trametes cinnabarina]